MVRFPINLCYLVPLSFLPPLVPEENFFEGQVTRNFTVIGVAS